MLNITKRYFFVIAILIAVFSGYNYLIYTSEGNMTAAALSPKAKLGQQIWQENSCWACHQLYGSGGYLGPDLSNIYSHPDKGPSYIKAFLSSGVKTMPKFNFSETEKEAVVLYLKGIDETGYYPNFDANFDISGWVELKYKGEK
jgi:nitric oxide reductase subunit C